MPADLYGREVKRRKQSDVASSSSISSSSFLSLKAELAKHHSSSSGSGSGSGSSSRPTRDEAEGSTTSNSSSHQRNEYSLPSSSSSSKRRGEAGGTSLLSGSFGKPNRKLPTHLRPSPSTALRAAKDVSPPFYSSEGKKSKKPSGSTSTLSSWSSTPSAQLERDRNLVLERKARLYDQLKHGLSGGSEEEDLREEGRLGGLIDWERKIEEGGSGSESEGEGEGGSDERGGEGEETIEFQDELGRTRRLPRSQVPMAQLIEMKRREEENEAANIPLLHGPQQHFPILTNTSVPHHLDENAAPEEQHFDASAEVRNRGAGFYRFTAGNEEERKRQMAGLKEERERTLRERERREREKGWNGDVQADGEGGGGGDESGVAGGRTAPSGNGIKLTKGERRLAERRELIEARRREVAAAKRHDAGQDEEAGSSIAAHAEAEAGKSTPGSNKSAAVTEEERRQREQQQRAIDHFLDEVDEEYRSRLT